MRRSLSLLVLTSLVGLLLLGRGTAMPPPEADPNRDYPITPEVGEWVVLAAYYTGPEAEMLARQMVYKIRTNPKLEDRMPAYVFVFQDKERLREHDEMKRANAMARRLLEQSGDTHVNDGVREPIKAPIIQVPTQYGVLIGGYADVKTADAAAAIIRKKMAPELKASGSTMEVCEQKIVDEKTHEVTMIRARINPFSMAMVTRNPSLPSQQHAERKADPLLKKFNENEAFSLLDCKQTHTLLVKEYLGAASVGTIPTKGTGFLATIGLGSGGGGEALDAAAKQAHETARVLRAVNFEAYVLHTRNSSAVTIGGFSGPNDPAIARVTQQLAQLRERMSAQAKTELMQTPTVVEIPRP